MGFYKNIVVLVQNGTQACGSVRVVANGNVLQLKVHADLPDGDELYLGIADGDGYCETFPLGKSGRLSKTVETVCRLSTTFEPVFAVAEVRRGYCKILALGGTKGDARLSLLLQDLFERQPYYLPPVKKLPDGIELIGVEIPGAQKAREERADGERGSFRGGQVGAGGERTSDDSAAAPIAPPGDDRNGARGGPERAEDAVVREGGAPVGKSSEERAAKSGKAAEAAFSVPYANPDAVREHPGGAQGGGPGGEPKEPGAFIENGGTASAEAYVPEDALLREDTTVADLLENEAQVESIENYYDRAYEEKQRAARIRSHYPVFSPSKPDYESYRLRRSAGILSRETEETVREVADLLERQSGEEEPKKRFYDTVQPQLDKLFRDYGPEEYLEKLIEDSRWARVDYDGGRNFYTVGVIYNGDQPAYICYGVPGEYSTVPPQELDGYCEWLPRDIANPESKGYWMMYQDAVTGESVEVAPR